MMTGPIAGTGTDEDWEKAFIASLLSEKLDILTSFYTNLKIVGYINQLAAAEYSAAMSMTFHGTPWDGVMEGGDCLDPKPSAATFRGVKSQKVTMGSSQTPTLVPTTTSTITKGFPLSDMMEQKPISWFPVLQQCQHHRNQPDNIAEGNIKIDPQLQLSDQTRLAPNHNP